MKRYHAIEQRAKALAIQHNRWVVVGRPAFSVKKKPTLYQFVLKPGPKQLECIQVSCTIDPNGDLTLPE